MNFLNRIKQRFNNMKTVSALLSDAERIANELGESSAGAEHLVAAAIAMPDSAAKRAFEKISVDPESYVAAINRQQEAALENIGFDISDFDLNSEDISVNKSRFPTASESAKNVLQKMAAETKFTEADSVTGADVLLAVLNQKPRIAIDVLKLMGINLTALEVAARAVKNNATVSG